MRCREGCPARFYGLNSHQAATTAKIRNIGISLDDPALAIAAYTGRRRARTRESARCSLAEYMLGHAAMRLPGTVAAGPAKVAALPTSWRAASAAPVAANTSIRAMPGVLARSTMTIKNQARTAT